MNQLKPHQARYLPKKGYVVRLVWFQVYFWSLLQSAGQIKWCTQRKWGPELVNRKGVVFHQDKSYCSLNRMCYHTHHILHLRTITCSGLCRILWIVEPSPQIKTSKTTWTSFLPASIKYFMSVESIHNLCFIK